MIIVSQLTTPPPKEQIEGILWNRSYLSLPPKEQAQYRHLKDWRLWWGLFVGIILAIYAFFLWWRIRHPW